ncbi:hypothetical protein [Chryseobacterium sp.]|jgi:hypothetical protein|uniref:hypothetical protein n=1 Tax=Chryseobacterium sp. TaxID=1871047 RepID=UPI00284E5972|nr:hypothetical protein [Chryseobacterium sp.]MDR3025161.1 hypothetical protein [Chryseobacterium sp.]
MILGTQNPVVGKEEIYQISDFSGGIFAGNDIQYFWYLWRKQKNGTWLDITKKEPKSGAKVTYKLGETFLGTQFKIQVYKATKNVLTQKFDTRLFGELIIVPTSSKKPSIERVILFNGGSKDVNKAHYSDTLTARAHCVAMFNQTVEFHLWEDDAEGPGHNPTVNKNNKHSVPFTAKVNEKGIAEASIKLLKHEKILKSIANKYLMKGDKDEGKNHEYYVTASYYGKIQGANQVNVNVANPDYKKEQPKQQTSSTHQSPSTPKPQEPKKPVSQPQKAQPKQNTPKFPATKISSAPRQADVQARITDAYFVNNNGQKLSKAVVGDWVRVCIHTSNMIGKHVQYVVWEYDALGFNDEISRSGRLEVKGNVITTGGFTITEKMFEKGADIGDSESQNYFIEVLPLDVSAYSKRFGVSSDGLMEVEKVKSTAVVKGQKQIEQSSTCICKRYDLVWGDKIGCNERKKVIEVAKNLGVDPN